MKALFALAALAMISAPALAQQTGQKTQIKIEGQVLQEKSVTDSAGKRHVTYEPPKAVASGDILVFKLLYNNPTAEPAANFNVKNPIPDNIIFISTDTPEASVSADGGKTFSTLAVLRVTAADGRSRPGKPGDVTHVLYTFPKPIPPGAKGEVSFRGMVK